MRRWTYRSDDKHEMSKSYTSMQLSIPCPFQAFRMITIGIPISVYLCISIVGNSSHPFRETVSVLTQKLEVCLEISSIEQREGKVHTESSLL